MSVECRRKIKVVYVKEIEGRNYVYAYHSGMHRL